MWPEAAGALARAYSSAQTTCWVEAARRLPYPSSLQPSPIHPPRPSSRSQSGAGRVTVEVRRQPATRLTPEDLVLSPESELHARPLPPSPVTCPTRHRFGRAFSAAARAIASTCSSNGIGSTPTVPGRKSAIRSGVQEPSAYAARSSRGCAHTAILGPATV